MTEQEAKDALFKLHFEYMKHTPKERLALYDEYQAKRNEIKHQLARVKFEVKENETKTK